MAITTWNMDLPIKGWPKLVFLEIWNPQNHRATDFLPRCKYLLLVTDITRNKCVCGRGIYVEKSCSINFYSNTGKKEQLLTILEGLYAKFYIPLLGIYLGKL